MWMLLNPREAELLSRPITGDGENAQLLRTIVNRIDRSSGSDPSLDISGADWLRIQAAARNYRLGYEQQFKALIEAGLR